MARLLQYLATVALKAYIGLILLVVIFPGFVRAADPSPIDCKVFLGSFGAMHKVSYSVMRGFGNLGRSGDYYYIKMLLGDGHKDKGQRDHLHFEFWRRTEDLQFVFGALMPLSDINQTHIQMEQKPLVTDDPLFGEAPKIEQRRTSRFSLKMVESRFELKYLDDFLVHGPDDSLIYHENRQLNLTLSSDVLAASGSRLILATEKGRIKPQPRANLKFSGQFFRLNPN